MIAQLRDTATYRVLIEDRLAMEVEGRSLEAVIVAIGERLRKIGPEIPDADLVIWRSGRVEAIARWRSGWMDEPVRFGDDWGRVRGRPRVTIASMMGLILACAAILAALRSRQGVAAVGAIVMIGLVGAIAGSMLMSIRHVSAFFRDTSP